MKLFVDASRPAPEGWVPCRTPEDAVIMLYEQDVTEMSISYDFGDFFRALTQERSERTGHYVLERLEDIVYEDPYFAVPDITIHHATSAQRREMEETLAWIEHCRDTEVL